jgi:hypothetical protein
VFNRDTRFLLKGKQNFSVVWRALASGGGAGQFRSKWVRAKFRIEHHLGNCKFEGFASPRSRAQQKIFHCNVNFAHPTIFFLKGSEKFLRDASPDKQVAGLLLKIPKWKRKKFYCNKYFNWKIFIIHL